MVLAPGAAVAVERGAVAGREARGAAVVVPALRCSRIGRRSRWSRRACPRRTRAAAERERWDSSDNHSEVEAQVERGTPPTVVLAVTGEAAATAAREPVAREAEVEPEVQAAQAVRVERTAASDRRFVNTFFRQIQFFADVHSIS